MEQVDAPLQPDGRRRGELKLNELVSLPSRPLFRAELGRRPW